jgi:ribosomal protein L16 Arg81 hydroxylase
VITLQVAGEKRWLVYEPVLELPLKDQRYRSALGEPAEPVLDVTARQGDTLYLPRGWLHQALTTDFDSLHITIGVNVRRWVDEARAELDAAEQDVARAGRSWTGSSPSFAGSTRSVRTTSWSGATPSSPT